MKTPTFTTIFVSLTLLLSLSACKRPTENTPAASAAFEPVDPRTDIVAATDPGKHILYVVADQKEVVLKQLGATALPSDEMYSISAINLMHHRSTFTFRVQTATQSEIFLLSATNLHLGNLLLYSLYDRFAQQDTARGTFVGKIDSGGVCYRIYKNAKCVEVSKAYETDCIEETVMNQDSTFSKTGRSFKIKAYGVSHCNKGTSMCVETLCVMNTTSFFNNGNCKGAPIRERESSLEYNCAE